MVKSLKRATGVAIAGVGLAVVGVAPNAQADQWNCSTDYFGTTTCSGGSNGGGFYQRSQSCDALGIQCSVSENYMPGQPLPWGN